MVRRAAASWALLAAACSATPEEPGWRDLFNGRDLEGWEIVGTAVWRVEGGEIVGGQEGDPRRSGLLVTRETFRDFELSLEFKIDEHGKYNSGVYLRHPPGRAARAGYQVNIGRGAAGEYCGGLFLKDWLAKGDEHDLIRRPGDWNSLFIRARGARITVRLNGVEVVDYTDPAPEPRLLEPGAVALQTYGAEGHAGWVRFRRLRIRPLPPPD
jgi:hypothetical protein